MREDEKKTFGMCLSDVEVGANQTEPLIHKAAPVLNKGLWGCDPLCEGWRSEEILHSLWCDREWDVGLWSLCSEAYPSLQASRRVLA